jgi:hypothetical protein
MGRKLGNEAICICTGFSREAACCYYPRFQLFMMRAAPKRIDPSSVLIRLTFGSNATKQTVPLQIKPQGSKPTLYLVSDLL